MTPLANSCFNMRRVNPETIDIHNGQIKESFLRIEVPKIELSIPFQRPFEVHIDETEPPENFWNVKQWWKYWFGSVISVSSGVNVYVRKGFRPTIQKAFTQVCIQMRQNFDQVTS